MNKPLINTATGNLIRTEKGSIIYRDTAGTYRLTKSGQKFRLTFDSAIPVIHRSWR